MRVLLAVVAVLGLGAAGCGPDERGFYDCEIDVWPTEESFTAGDEPSSTYPFEGCADSEEDLRAQACGFFRATDGFLETIHCEVKSCDVDLDECVDE